MPYEPPPCPSFDVKVLIMHSEGDRERERADEVIHIESEWDRN